MQKHGRLGRGEVTLCLATWCRFFANGSLIPIVIDQSFHETKDFFVNSVTWILHRAELYRSAPTRWNRYPERESRARESNEDCV